MGMPEPKKYGKLLILMFLLLLGGLSLLLWSLAGLTEGTSPEITLDPRPAFLAGPQEFSLRVTDKGQGLKGVKVHVQQEGRKIPLLEERFPAPGFFGKGPRVFEARFGIDPAKQKLAQGKTQVIVEARDHSIRNGGDGNLGLLELPVIVDTVAPTLRVLAPQNYVNPGGTGLAVYHASPDAVSTGIFVEDVFFPGFPAVERPGQEAFHCYFALPLTAQDKTPISLWAVDEAGNERRVRFPAFVRKKTFRTDKLLLSTAFLRDTVQKFPEVSRAAGSDIEAFLDINRELRAQNARTFRALADKTDPRRLWEEPWLRLKNAATMATFGDRRLYFYENVQVDEQIHMGVDLASLAGAEVGAANRGRVIFAGDLGIYGLTVVLDHGQGIASTYSHLQKILVETGQDVPSGHGLGLTGQTGLAGGDHLHFGMMVSGVFVNPLEWWDPHWIKDNVTKKWEMGEK